MADAEPVGQPSASALSPRRLLLVEDDRATYVALSRILKRKGWDVAVAMTVQEALAELTSPREWVVLDLMLPDGDGAEVLRAIRAADLPLRVAVTTGICNPARVAAVEALGPDLLLKKPIDLPLLLRFLETAH